MNIALNNTKTADLKAQTPQQLLIETLATIPKLQRQVFLLKTFNKKSTQYICTTLNISEKQFWGYMHDARKQLMNII